jgi:S-adenosyl-L-methionine hydrolase (adenosine-forming)
MALESVSQEPAAPSSTAELNPSEARKPRRVITLTTDFGLSDHYVGTMKGVLLSRCPEAQIVDISHEIRPFSIISGAYAIDQALAYFPAGSIHVVVIDPGVGTLRKPLLVEAAGQFFIAPDNGVLSFVLHRDPRAIVWEISNKEIMLPSPSATFHGRDVFAPAAAALACGQVKPDDVGPIMAQPILQADLFPRAIGPNYWRGIVLSVDHFGNIVTNMKASDFPDLASRAFALRLAGFDITEMVHTFGAATSGLCFAYYGSSGFVEIGMNQQSAAELLKVKEGEPLELQVSMADGAAT